MVVPSVFKFLYLVASFHLTPTLSSNCSAGADAITDWTRFAKIDQTSLLQKQIKLHRREEGGKDISPSRQGEQTTTNFVDGVVGLKFFAAVLLTALLLIFAAAVTEQAAYFGFLPLKLPSDWGHRWLMGIGAFFLELVCLVAVGLFVSQFDFPFLGCSYLPLPDASRWPLLILGCVFMSIGCGGMLLASLSSWCWQWSTWRFWSARSAAAGLLLFCLVIFHQDCNLMFLSLLLTSLWLHEELPQGFPVVESVQAYVAVMHFWAGLSKINRNFLADGASFAMKPFESLIHFPENVFGHPRHESIENAMRILVITVEIGGALLVFTRCHRCACAALLVYHGVAMGTLLWALWDPLVWPWNLLLLLVLWRCVVDSAGPMSGNAGSRTHAYAPLVVGVLTFLWGAYDPEIFALYNDSDQALSMHVSSVAPWDGTQVPPTLKHLLSGQGCLDLGGWALHHDQHLITTSVPQHIARRLTAAGAVGAYVDIIEFTPNAPMLHLNGTSHASKVLRCTSGGCESPWYCDVGAAECEKRSLASSSDKCWCRRGAERSPIQTIAGNAVRCEPFDI